MVQVNDRFSFERDNFGWTLFERTMTPTKKDPSVMKERERRTHHANIEQVCQSVLDRSVGNAEELTAVIDAVTAARDELGIAIRALGPVTK